jgi:uncharacterized protein (DUF362 family)
MNEKHLSRRDFLKRAAAAGLAAAGIGELGGLGAPAEGAEGPTIAVASRRDPAELVRAAVEGVGGMAKFVKRGARVLVKPNIAWARKPDDAATTNPEVVAEVVRLCRQAGAREVKVMDHALDRPDSLLLRMTGIEAAARGAGAQVSIASSAALYEGLRLPRGRAIKSVEVLRDLQRADVFINVPIAKVHGTTGVTLGCKNLMGTVWNRGAWHTSSSLDQAIADDAAVVKPLLGRKAEQIEHLRRAHAAGVGEIALSRVKVKNV